MLQRLAASLWLGIHNYHHYELLALLHTKAVFIEFIKRFARAKIIAASI